jgi:hypothetical protein
MINIRPKINTNMQEINKSQRFDHNKYCNSMQLTIKYQIYDKTVIIQSLNIITDIKILVERIILSISYDYDHMTKTQIENF